MTPDEILSAVRAGLEAAYAAEINFGRGSERTHTWASGWRPCSRCMALDLLHPEDAEIEVDGLARMAAGRDFEAAATSRLIRAGRLAEPSFTVEAQQEHFSLRGGGGAGEAAGQVVLTGKIEGKLYFEGGIRVPYEIKGGESVRRVRTLDDLFRSRWASRYPRQLLMYLWGTGQPLGIFVLDSGAIPTLVPVAVDDHLDMAEQFLASAEAAYRSKHAAAPLPVFSSNPEDCTRCDHRGKSCAPPWYSGEGPWVSDSPELAQVVADVVTNAEAATKHTRAKKRLADLCRGKQLVVIGEHTITGKPHGKGWRLTIQGQTEEEGGDP